MMNKKQRIPNLLLSCYSDSLESNFESSELSQISQISISSEDDLLNIPDETSLYPPTLADDEEIINYLQDLFDNEDTNNVKSHEKTTKRTRKQSIKQRSTVVNVPRLFQDEFRRTLPFIQLTAWNSCDLRIMRQYMETYSTPDCKQFMRVPINDKKCADSVSVGIEQRMARYALLIRVYPDLIQQFHQIKIYRNESDRQTVIACSFERSATNILTIADPKANPYPLSSEIDQPWINKRRIHVGPHSSLQEIEAYMRTIKQVRYQGTLFLFLDENAMITMIQVIPKSFNLLQKNTNSTK